MKVKNVTLRKPWITKSVRKKNLLYKRFLVNPTSYREKTYKSYKNKLTHSLRVAKRLYYNKKLDEYKSNAKSTGKLLNELINKKKMKCNFPSIFKSNEEDIFNPAHIANRFCEYFTNIGPNLAKDIYKLQIGKFMYQCKSGLLPDSFNDMCLVTRQVHSYGTRSSELFYLPQCRTNIRKFSISFQGPNFYNSVSPEIRNATSTASFCSKLKAFLLS